MQFYRNWVIQRPWLVLVLLLLLVGFSAMQLSKVRVDASSDSLVLEGDDDLEFYREVVDKFGSSEFLLLAYELSDPIMSDATLGALDALVADLQQVEGVASVMSILDVPLLYSPQVSIAALGSGLKTLRSPEVDRSLVQRELVESPVYRQLLSSLDESTTAIQVNLQRDMQFVSLLEARESLRKQKLANPDDAAIAEALQVAEQRFKSYSLVAAERQKKLVADVRAIVQKHREGAKQIFIGGVPMIASDMVSFVLSDLQTFGLGILVFIVLLLTVIFREPRWVLLPMLSCLVTNIIMLGVLGGFDWRMTVISSNFVALLLIITLAISVHLVVRFRELEAISPEQSPAELAAATAAAMFRPCVYTVLTTVIAFASLVISGIRPVIDFGWMMTVGVLVALLVSFTLVPAGMATGLGRRSRATAVGMDSAGDGESREGVFTMRFAAIAERFGGTVVVVALLILLFAISGIFRLQVENRFIDYFDENTEIYQGMELIDSDLGGTIPLDIVLLPSALNSGDAESASFADGGADAGYAEDEFADDFDDSFEDGFDDSFEDGFEDMAGNDSAAANEDDFADDFADDYVDDFADDFADESGDEFAVGSVASEPGSDANWFTRAGLDRVSAVHDHLDSLPQTGKVLSLSTLYRVANDLLGGSVDDIQLSFAQRGLPAEINEIMVDPYLHQASGQTRINVRVMETNRSLNRNEFLEQLHVYMQEELGYQPDEYRFSGMLVLYNNMLQSLFTSQILTLGAVFVAITLMLLALFRQFSLALLGILPNLLAALLVLGCMGWFGLPLDLMTITIAAISIGIGVDNTIHYIYRFKTEFARDRRYVAAMYRSHGSIGRAMYYTSLTIVFGFSILALSNFKPSIYFGLLTGAAMLSALLGALLLLPRLLIIFKPLGPEART